MSKPKVLIDGVVFENDSQIGIWRIFYETIARTSTAIDYTLLLDRVPVQPLPSGIRMERWKRPTSTSMIRRIPRAIASWPINQRLRHRHPDAIWHSTFYTCDPRSNSRSVVTVYDMIAERLYMHRPYVEERQVKLEALKRANRILAISNSTAENLRMFFPQLDENVQVMYLGCEHLQNLETPEREHPPTSSPIGEAPYCLFVGGRFGYKNFATVLDSLRERQWPADVQLVVVGQPFDNGERALVSALKVQSKITHLGRVSEVQLSQLYQCATAFLFPSLMEGFGLPIIEAQLHGTIPIVSNTEVFREIVGQGAMYFDPHSPEALALAVREAYSHAGRQRLVALADTNVPRFSWNRASEILVNCYESLWSESSTFAPARGEAQQRAGNQE